MSIKDRINQNHQSTRDNVIVYLGGSGDGKTYSLLKDELEKGEKFLFLSLEETTRDLTDKRNRILNTPNDNTNDNLIGKDDIRDEPIKDIILDAKHEGFTTIILDSWTRLYQVYGLHRVMTIFEEIKEAASGMKLKIIAHRKEASRRQLQSAENWEFMYYGGSYLHKEMTCGFLLIEEEGERFWVCIKEHRNDPSIAKGMKFLA